MMKKTSKYGSFDIENFLVENDLDFKKTGKNIGRNWWGIRDCPFCGDDGYHMGVNLTTKKFSCFVCGESSQAPRFIKEALGYREDEWSIVFELLNKYLGDGYVAYDPRQSGSKVILPSGVGDIDGRGLQYLRDRKFGAEVVEEYRLQQTGHHSRLVFDEHESDFRWRIIIPIIMHRRLVSYTGRDYTGKQDPKYQHPIIEASVISTHSCIYNYDTLQERGTGVFVEGPTDVWRWGKETVAMMGTKFTKVQLEHIAIKRLKKGYVVFDEGAMDKARKLANAMIGIVDKIKLVNIGEGDVGELDPIEAIRIKQQILHS